MYMYLHTAPLQGSHPPWCLNVPGEPGAANRLRAKVRRPARRPPLRAARPCAPLDGRGGGLTSCPGVVRMTTGLPAHRHGEVDIIFNERARLHSDAASRNEHHQPDRAAGICR